MSNKVVISGAVVAEPEFRVISDTFRVLEFPLYDNEQRKDKDTGKYTNVEGSTLKVKVILKNDLADQWNGKILKGDIIEFSGSITEREFTKKDNTKGRAVESTWVDGISIKWREGGVTEESPF